MMFCPYCGTEIKRGKFCARCGAPAPNLAELGQRPAEELRAEPTQRLPEPQQPMPVMQPAPQPVQPYKGTVIQCPRCGGHSVQIVDGTPAGTQTSLNLNPLKPFTISNTKKKKKRISGAKVAAAILTGGVSAVFTGFRTKVGTQVMCMSCGAVWEEKKL